MEFVRELEEYGLKCSVFKSEDKFGSEVELDGISLEVRIIIFVFCYDKYIKEINVDIV